MSGIFAEIKLTQRLIQENRDIVYKLEEWSSDNNHQQVNDALACRKLVLRALELYEKSLESTVNTAARRESREKNQA